jgi:sugar phosphate isomerase/epimerase
MKFSFYSGFNQMLAERGLDATAAWAQENGFSAVEFLNLPIENWHNGVDSVSQAQNVRKTLQSYGLTTACYSVAVNLLNGSAAVEHLKRQAELAAELGSPFLHHTLIDSLLLPQDAPTFQEVFPRVLDGASEVARYCETLGLTCLYEEQGLYFNGKKNLGKFFQAMKKCCKNVGVCGDFGNILFVDESPDSFLKAFKKDVKHVHIKDYTTALTIENREDKEAWLRSRKGVYLKDVPLGEGVINAQKCFKILKKAGYDGFFSLELVDPIRNNPTAMKLAKSLFA